MIPTLIRLALSQRWLVLMLAGMLVALGVVGLPAAADRRLPRHLRADGPNHHHLPRPRPEEVEQQVTIPLEIVMRSVPRVDKIRSRTIFGLSIVEVLFEEGVENYWARQRVQGEARRGHAARRRETRPRPAGHGLRRDLSLRAGLRRHARPDGPAHAAGLGGGSAAAPLRGRGRRGEFRRLPEAIHGDLQPGPARSATTSRWATSSTPSRATTPAPAAASSRGAACRS